ncbi:hypothetical protein CA223_06670 [Sphingomonas koreensis]|uniref:Uncharacterized protein n=1 Tax=Sphingomonas koreensis TaxID=93064 RepID=A0A1L6J859_9SPHN|nr:hypothetical protein [Sphingomonas koreensis]APR52017.1 hypothetical protein BRX40_05815 [Sphingomonas koreensis]RSU22820.1 hypothetical protein CA224_05430 [Sphingomonas koreensis]RSU30706.1 hypothetical protein CA222_01115 [Sphingomonas koreensis]RSU31801.1 hypothetical protein CA225_00195 [Sphingomonas koreensis]RSU39278.1 hypothetical protein BRX39_01335 [Sphingomonas koreensis]
MSDLLNAQGLRASIAEALEEGHGFWRACSGCQESCDGVVSVQDYPYSEVFRCQPGGGCRECGGLGVIWDDTDYDAMARAMLADDASDIGSDEARGYWRGLDHIANFINALDSSAMSAKEVRTAIYAECLTARPAPAVDATALEAARFVESADSSGEFVTGDDGFVVYWPQGFGGGAFSAWTLRVFADELDRRNAGWAASLAAYLGTQR